jgi:heat shock protein HtpX
MARTRYAPDRGLTSRMLVTMFLLGLVYVVFIAIMFAISPSIGALATVGALIFLCVQYFFSDKITLFAMHGHEVTPDDAPELHGVIDRICALSNTPKPRVAITDVDVPNAFATGRNQKKAVVCVTTGLLRRLDPEELEGVLAHEMSHVAHRDVAVMTIASFLGIVAGLITRFGLEWGLWGGFRSRDGDQNTGMVLLAVVAVSAVAFAISFVLTRALSRYRELSADRAAALLTGRPSKLSSALVKVTDDIAKIPTRDLRSQQAFNAFFFTPAFGKGTSVASLFATHPPLEKRLQQLSDITAQLSRGA